MASRKRKAYPQLVAIELLLVAVAGLAIYFLAPVAGLGHSLVLFLTGVAVDRSLTLVLRHRNKPVRIQSPLTRKPAGRR